MMFNEQMIKMLSESFCPNDMEIEDCSHIFDCQSQDACRQCWIESLRRLSRTKKQWDELEK